MKLKSIVVASLMTIAASSASAKDYVVDLGTPSQAGTYSTGFNAVVNSAGSFQDTFTFTPVTKGWSKGSLVTISNNAYDKIKFENATLNDAPFSFGTAGQGTYGFTLADFFTGPLILKVWGVASPSLAVGTNIAAAYSGTVTVSAVPEPETYAMMLAGLGLFGFIARRKGKDSKKSEMSLS